MACEMNYTSWKTQSIAIDDGRMSGISHDATITHEPYYNLLQIKPSITAYSYDHVTCL